MKTRTALVDPRIRLPYYTYVLKGLDELDIDWHFARLDSPDSDGMAISYSGQRFWIDANDLLRIEGEPYQWADVVGKVNCSHDSLQSHPKIVPLGPLFGIRYWKLPLGYRELLPMTAFGANFRKSLAGLRFQGKTRADLDSYYKLRMEQSLPLIWHRSRKWSGKHEAANSARLNFFEALAGLDVLRDAGLIEERISINKYLLATARSSLVFNCPAVHGCLGWKLGEYLALGKAIISTPITNVLPKPLVHGEHAHFVSDDVESISMAILMI